MSETGESVLEKSVVLGDDPVPSMAYDWFTFGNSVVTLVSQLHTVSQTSGICCGIVGSWGTGKSSFMRMMEAHLREKYRDCLIVWFTAWDPEGVGNLGDAMIYRFLSDISKDDKKLEGSFKELEKSLKIRKSNLDVACKALSSYSQVSPEPASKLLAGIGASLLTELDTPQRIKDIFKSLVEWLKNNKKVVFFFIDDLDRANGCQIRDILSELKVYISNPRIVAVLGFDDSYVNNALKPVLPDGINPKMYLEKIVTLDLKIPQPTPNQLRSYSEQLIHSFVPGIPQTDLYNLGRMAGAFSNGNPRRLKSLILSFANSIISAKISLTSSYELRTALIVNAAYKVGLLEVGALRIALNEGVEDEIVDVLDELKTKIPEQEQDIETISNEIEYLSPNFASDMVNQLRLHAERSNVVKQKEKEPIQLPSWIKQIFLPALSYGCKKGFLVDSEFGGFRVEQNSDVRAITLQQFARETNAIDLVRGSIKESPVFIIEGEQRILVFISSGFNQTIPSERFNREPFNTIRTLINNSPLIVKGKPVLIWAIDDINALENRNLKALVSKTELSSNGLKYPIMLRLTKQAKVEELLCSILS
jgi:hypothetical protein